MTTILSCLAITALLPMFPHLLDAILKFKQFGSYNNVEPRKQNAELTGAGARAVAAQLNAWEALGLYTAACVVVVLGQGDLEKAATASVVFVCARIAHTILYVVELNKLRSLSFLVGFVASIYMMLLGL